MKSAAMLAVLFIFLFSTTGRAEVKYFKIAPQEKKTDAASSPGTPKPGESKAVEATAKPETPVEGSTTGAPAPPETKKGKASGRSAKQDQAPAQPVKQGKASTAQPAKSKRQQPKGPYITSIQICSFQKQDQAQAEAERLKALGIDAFVRHERVRGKGMWYRVYAGKFNSRRKALDYERELKRKGIIRWSWIKRLPWPSGQAPAAAQPARKQPSAAKPAARADRTPKQTPTRKQTAAAPGLTRKSKPAPQSSAQPAAKKPPPSRAARTPRKKTKRPATEKTTAKSAKIESIQPGRLSLGIRTGVLLAGGASDFVITESAGSDTNRYEFESTKPLSGLSVSVRLNDRWSADSIIEQVVMTNLDMQYMSLGPKMRIIDRGAFKTYIRAAVVYGNLAWDEAPGEFDSAMGMEAGIGVDLVGTRFNGGLEASYRSIAFDYTAPSDGSATATDSQIDFSGFVLTGCVRIHF